MSAANGNSLDSLVVRLSDSVTIIHGDCRDVLPLACDAVVTDPPYGIDADANAFKNGVNCKANGFKEHLPGEWDAGRIDPALLALVLRQGREHIIWGGNYYTDILPPTMRWLVWDKVQRGFSMADCELAWTDQAKASRVFSYARGNESGFAPKRNDGFQNSHPTQKPVALMAWCLTFLPEGATVLDPFMGSASTGCACIATGRKFIGIEKDARYFEIARARLENELRQGLLPLTHNKEISNK
jgi:DNA modification methylase